MRVPCPVAALVVAAALTLLALPSAASAQDAATCRPGAPQGAQGSIESRYGRLDPSAVVNGVLGDAQDAGTELDAGNASWSAGVAPGPLSVDAARAGIEQAIRSAYAADDAAFLLGTMRVLAQPYATSYLASIQMQLMRELFTAGLTRWSLERTCRITIVLGAPNGAAERTKAEAIAAPYGDAVRVKLTVEPGPTPVTTGPPGPADAAKTPGGSPPLPTAGGPAPRTSISLWRVVKVAVTRRCVRGKTISIRPLPAVVGLRATVAGRTVTAAPGETLRVGLRGRSTAVRVDVAAAGGRTATRTLTYRRCAVRR